MSAVDITVENTLQDWRDYQSFWAKTVRTATPTRWYTHLLNMLIWAALAYAFMVLFRSFHVPTVLFMALLFVATLIIGVLAYRRAMILSQPQPRGIFLGRHRYTFSQTGIEIQGTHYTTHVAWPAVRQIAETKSLVILVLDSIYGIVLPKRDIVHLDSFINELKELKGQ